MMPRDDMAETDRFDGVLATAGIAMMRLVARNPVRFVLTTMACVIVGYASLNALAFQEQAHPSAFFETRHDGPGGTLAAGPVPDDRGEVTRIVFDDRADTPERTEPVGDLPATALPAPALRVETPDDARPDPMAELQTMLASLGFYEGAIDGIHGPVTVAAVEDYKASVGLRGIDLTTDELLTSLRNNTMVTAAIPTPSPRAEETQTPDQAPLAEPAPPRDRMVLKVQAGLRAFGNTSIVVDGVAGEHTRAAVREFQALFRMPVTGEIDEELVERMMTIGLID